MEIIKKSFGTHDGTFHADEVTACAFLLLYKLIEKDKIFRTRDATTLSVCEYVCDVGGVFEPKTKRFDHHQKEYAGDLSSAGMVLSYLKNQAYMDEHLYDHFNKNLVKSIDAHDIGKIEESKACFSQLISSFLPIDYNSSIQEKNEAFLKAVEFSYGFLHRMQDRFFYTSKCLDKVKEQMKTKKKYLVFEESMPWLDAFFELEGEKHPAVFVVMPTGNHWKLRGIPPDSNSRMMVRIPLPIEWAGLSRDELKEVSKIKGAIFCHKGRFISIWETKEDVLKALKYVLKKSGVDYGNDL